MGTFKLHSKIQHSINRSSSCTNFHRFDVITMSKPLVSCSACFHNSCACGRATNVNHLSITFAPLCFGFLCCWFSLLCYSWYACVLCNVCSVQGLATPQAFAASMVSSCSTWASPFSRFLIQWFDNDNQVKNRWKQEDIVLYLLTYGRGL